MTYKEDLKDRLLGKDGFLTKELKNLGDVPEVERAGAGKAIADIKKAIDKATKPRALWNKPVGELKK